MKVFLISIILLLLLSACNKHKAAKPVWINKADTLVLPGATFAFNTLEREWKVTLLTYTQPIQLATHFDSGKLTAGLLHKKGVTEGPAELCLENEGRYFYYPVYILNTDTIAFISREYRSPKTVNPDSNLHQQRFLHSFDVHRNILPVQPGHTYFYETDVNLAPKTGVFRAIKSEAITSFYMQPGSCTNLPVKATYNKQVKGYYVTAGPLKDAYNNTVADGTLIAFVYNDAEQTYRMEASLLGGYVSVVIPCGPAQRFTLKAVINTTFSNPVNLMP